ncbi:MAG: TIGR03087 family PEP-CTERM/XrtA system glycosyltransferase [Gammaproteobacteria bacterium]|nr:TIGR03087 family PEP-CTERM/XrtA system glycosyltransferase [Gammaproteobacteria bacterium]MDH5239223.1 TIGR03087 family PEP-CTERM/XrtA system glycosyltransferase [Gammaproteobacteria bacterium]MDH5259912.1 TIGR03087 family PEP-CTERM/XrtA system glycosyltransferase [Gammaproteobacteria bacterium]
MNILFICHRLPFPPKRGGKIRPYNVIRHLAEQGHSVTVVTLARSDEELHEGKGLEEIAKVVHVGRIGRFRAVLQMILRLPTLTPSSMGYFFSRGLERSARTELSSGAYDVVFVHCSSVAQYANGLNGARSVLDFGDMDSQKWLDYSSFKPFPLSLGYWLEGMKLMRAEKRLASSFDLCTCTTQAELETLDSYCAGTQTGWFPNGVDASYFSPSGDSYRANSICFVGRMDYYPNQQGVTEFCDHVLPLLRRRLPDVSLTIVGAEPSRAIRRLGLRPGVEVTGTVDDVRPYVWRSAASIAPLAIARGTQNKVLESMAMGVPVVCSRKAARGVDAIPGQHLLVADTPEEYEQQLGSLLSSSAKRDALATAGRARVLSHHDWRQSMRKLDQLVGAICNK